MRPPAKNDLHPYLNPHPSCYIVSTLPISFCRCLDAHCSVGKQLQMGKDVGKSGFFGGGAVVGGQNMSQRM